VGEWGGRYFYRTDNNLEPIDDAFHLLGPVVAGPQWFTAAYTPTIQDPGLYTLTWPAGSTTFTFSGSSWANVASGVWAGAGPGFQVAPHNGDYAVLSFGFNGLWWTACGHNGPVPFFSWFRGCS
jgi:hypothetical protein